MCFLFAQSVNARYIRLQLIGIEIQNILLTAETCDSGARVLLRADGENGTRNKISELALSRAKQALDFNLSVFTDFK
jgi:hypothetical protein